MSLLVLLVLSSAFAAPKTPKPAPTPPPTIPPPGPNDPALCGPKPGGGSYGTCYAYSTDKTFVDCNTTTNRCYCLDSFSGNASPNNPCDCVEPKTVFIETDLIFGGWGNLDSFGLGTPHCINLPPLLAIDAANTRNQKHIDAVQKFYSNMIGDLPTQILIPGGEQRLTDIVSPTVRSRISPAGEFDGFEGVIEYFYGFVANPTFRVISVDFRSIAASGNTVGAKVNVFLNNSRFAQSGGHPPQYWNLTTFAFFTFNDKDLIESIDVSVPNLGAILDIPDTQPGAAQIRQGLINQTCLLMLAPQPANPLTGAPALPNGYCGNFPIWTGNNPLERIANCQQVLSAIPYGTRYRNNANSFVCRSLHAALIPFRPNPHCFHAGPDGGGRCVDVPYSDYYLKDY